MTALAYTVAFEGIEARMVEVQCAVAPGIPAFSIVGLPDKAVSEARERVRSALSSMAIALPSKRITINLSPADLPKIGSHFDLPIAVALLAALEIIPADDAEKTVALGELSLNGNLVPVLGALPAAMAAASEDRTLLCPYACGPEAAWVGTANVIAARTLADVIRHYNGQSVIAPSRPGEVTQAAQARDLSEVKGQERAKRAIEIAAAGRHHLLMVGSPGSGKSMLAARIPGILPPLTPSEALETSMIHSVSGLLDEGGISRERPFREPHHTASMAAIVGGGRGAKPGEISLAHNGVLFMDEFPEFPRTVLETLRQPIETGEVVVARANAHVKYPCRFMLVAAANPCKCGYLTDPARACSRAPICGEDYMGRISGPLMDRFDLRVEVPPVAFTDLDLPQDGESSEVVRDRVKMARAAQATRYADVTHVRVNADAEGKVLEDFATPDAEGRALLTRVAERFGLSARGYHRVLRVARTIADLDGEADVRQPHVAEAVSYRLAMSKEV
ncbi:MAG: YifB family Mg chelatase-like AAA ATPase [Loktanella sp.]|jgi:magnesium chelatase family protein|nr:YifB family Mg chelatase-like AAA ATPase [Loktanella sp.]MDO7607711.1 YifB family Mg chelatase-like AAA ATPase [Loktanella sp.]MDO7622682.1 YifB family Mg chelatase-like AAA ATPase [Loktanella sp.]MDO7626123.1 YifB family Mg chelatase-like AAA ATPase [Loktanella sp.]MDO7666321.1 YifB family Mg chelatase-like AAA ATPase [Loktanella sp.]